MWEEIKTIRELLDKERAWRLAVFTGRKQIEKVAEVDQALAALDHIEGKLRELGAVVDPPRQMKLWPEASAEASSRGSVRGASAEAPSRRLL